LYRFLALFLGDTEMRHPDLDHTPTGDRKQSDPPRREKNNGMGQGRQRRAEHSENTGRAKSVSNIYLKGGTFPVQRGRKATHAAERQNPAEQRKKNWSPGEQRGETELQLRRASGSCWEAPVSKAFLLQEKR